MSQSGLPQAPAPADSPAPYPVVPEVVGDHRGAEGPGRVNTTASVVDLRRQRGGWPGERKRDTQHTERKRGGWRSEPGREGHADPERWSGAPCAPLSWAGPVPQQHRADSRPHGVSPVGGPFPCPVQDTHPDRPCLDLLSPPRPPPGENPPLTASRCPRATEKPMARGAEPPRSRRLRSVVASTHSTSCRVPMISMPRPWPEFTPEASCRAEGQ